MELHSSRSVTTNKLYLSSLESVWLKYILKTFVYLTRTPDHSHEIQKVEFAKKLSKMISDAELYEIKVIKEDDKH